MGAVVHFLTEDLIISAVPHLPNFTNISVGRVLYRALSEIMCLDFVAAIPSKQITSMPLTRFGSYSDQSVKDQI